MWVKTTETAYFPERKALATINRITLINAGIHPDQTRRLIDCPEFNEDFVRKVLQIDYGSVANWNLHLVTYNFAVDSFEVVVSSTDFDPVPDGRLLPRMKPINCQY